MLLQVLLDFVIWWRQLQS